MITRNRPQLDFPYLMQALGIDPDLLKISRADLQAVSVNVDAELKKLPHSAWAGRVAEGSTDKGGTAPKF